MAQRFEELEKEARALSPTQKAALVKTLLDESDSPNVEYVPENVRQTFGRLVEQWRAETMFESSFTELVLNPAYQRIIGLGEQVIPLLLEELEKESGQWFWALENITGANPVAPEDSGNSQKMKSAWLKWGVERGFLTR
jgi:hypothetical protein